MPTCEASEVPIRNAVESIESRERVTREAEDKAFVYVCSYALRKRMYISLSPQVSAVQQESNSNKTAAALHDPSRLGICS